MQTTLTNSENGQTGNNLPISNGWDIGVAMRDVYDTMERAMLPGLILGDVAYQIKVEGKDGLANPVHVSYIEWGFPKKNLTPEIVSLFRTWQFKKEDYGYSYEMNGVPIKVKVWERNYPFLTSTDLIFYGADEFKIPNPFMKYYKVRNLIK